MGEIRQTIDDALHNAAKEYGRTHQPEEMNLKQVIEEALEAYLPKELVEKYRQQSGRKRR